MDAGDAAVVGRRLVFRWRFQFRLRTLLVLTVVVALPFSWLGLEMKRAKEQRDAVAAIRRLGGKAIHDHEFDVTASDDGDLLVWLAQMVPPAPLWLRTLVGNDFFTTVDHVTLRVDTPDREPYLPRNSTICGACSTANPCTVPGSRSRMRGWSTSDV